jgi:hypothetical protein
MLSRPLPWFTPWHVPRLLEKSSESVRADDGSARRTAARRMNPNAADLGRIMRYRLEGGWECDLVHLYVDDLALIVMEDPAQDGEPKVERFPLDAIERVECGPPSSAAATGDCTQAETHLFVWLRDGLGRNRIELSLGAMDDDGPVRHLCAVLQRIVGSNLSAPPVAGPPRDVPPPR